MDDHTTQPATDAEHCEECDEPYLYVVEYVVRPEGDDTRNRYSCGDQDHLLQTIDYYLTRGAAYVTVCHA